MLLSEALAERADAKHRISELKSRLLQVAKIQEGDTPDEDPQELLREIEHVVERYEEVVQRINHTNSVTRVDDEMTLSDALARRDSLLILRRVYVELAEKAASRQDRYSQSEIRYMSTVDVAELRKKADDCARDYRELDTRIQSLNWSTELI